MGMPETLRGVGSLPWDILTALLPSPSPENLGISLKLRNLVNKNLARRYSGQLPLFYLRAFFWKFYITPLFSCFSALSQI